MVREMCVTAAIADKTNHSLRATGVRLFRAGIPERAIQGHTGHKSVEALRTYEGVSSSRRRGCALLSLTLRM